MSEILVGIDDSPGAKDALAFATRLAEAAGASLRLASVFPYSDVPGRASNAMYRDFLRGDAEATLGAAATTAGAVVTATEAIADPSPPHALHALAVRTGAALVVVGSTHRGPAGRVVPGSTGERLLHGSPCPVAIVPRGYAGDGSVQTIGVGYDASDEAAAALATACELARRFGAALRVIRVFDATHVGNPALMTIPGPYENMHEEYEARQREGLNEAVEALPAEVRAEAVFVAGNPGHDLATESENVDLMVVGSRGYGPRAAVLLGGVTHTLIRKAACPVVVLPRGSHGLEGLFAPEAEGAAQ
jgi:nucleotide-binding universal stress UspA family protein